MATLKEIRMYEERLFNTRFDEEALTRIYGHFNPGIGKTLFKQKETNMSKTLPERCKDCKHATNGRTLFTPGENFTIYDCHGDAPVIADDHCGGFKPKKVYPPILTEIEFQDMYPKDGDILKVLDLSILKWERVVAQEGNKKFHPSGLPHPSSLGRCALCTKFKAENTVGCGECPLNKKDRDCNNNGSIHSSVWYNRYTLVIFFRNAKVMLETLKEIKKEWVKAEEAKKKWMPKIGEFCKSNSPGSKGKVFFCIEKGGGGVKVTTKKEDSLVMVDINNGKLHYWNPGDYTEYVFSLCNKNGISIV